MCIISNSNYNVSQKARGCPRLCDAGRYDSLPVDMDRTVFFVDKAVVDFCAISFALSSFRKSWQTIPPGRRLFNFMGVLESGSTPRAAYFEAAGGTHNGKIPLGRRFSLHVGVPESASTSTAAVLYPPGGTPTGKVPPVQGCILPVDVPYPHSTPGMAKI